MTNVLTAMTNILTATSKKYLRLTPIEEKIKLLLLCPLYQWPVELTRQDDGGGRLPRDLFSGFILM